MEKSEIRQIKYDITRLKNLLRNYRNHMITEYYRKLPHVKPVEIIKRIDKSIRTLKFAL